MLIFWFPAVAVFDIAIGQTTLANNDSMGNTNEFDIRQHAAEAGLGLIHKQHFTIGANQLVIERHTGFGNQFRLVHIDRHYSHLKWSDGLWPNNAVVIMVLFYGRGNNATHTYTIAAHGHSAVFTVFVQHCGFHGFTVFGAELEDMTHFNTALNFQYAFSIWAWIA